MNLTMSLIKADIVAAKQAIEYYEKSNLKDIKNVAAYDLQQTMEKFNTSICIPKYIDDNSLVLTEWEAGSRYNTGLREA